MKKIIYLLIFAILLIPNILFAEEKKMIRTQTEEWPKI